MWFDKTFFTQYHQSASAGKPVLNGCGLQHCFPLDAWNYLIFHGRDVMWNIYTQSDLFLLSKDKSLCSGSFVSSKCCRCKLTKLLGPAQLNYISGSCLSGIYNLYEKVFAVLPKVYLIQVYHHTHFLHFLSCIAQYYFAWLELLFLISETNTGLFKLLM